MDSLFWRRYLDYSRPVPFSVRYLQSPSQYPQSSYRPLHHHHYYPSSSYRPFSSPYRVLYVNGKRVKVYSSVWDSNKTIDAADQKAVVLKVRKKRKTPSLILLAPRRCRSHQDLTAKTDSVWLDDGGGFSRKRLPSFSERYLAMQSKPHRRCHSYQDVSTLTRYSSQPSLSSLSMSHFWGGGGRRWVSNVDLLSPSSAYGSLEDLQYYSGHRTRSTEYLFPTPFSKWYSSSQSESGFSGSGFYRSPRTPYSIGGSDFGDYRTPSMFGDFRSTSRSSSVFGDNIELSLPAKYERYDADFNLIHSPGAGSEVEEYGRRSRAGSVFSGSELSYTDMGAAPNILESSLKSHDWVSKTDFERHTGYGTDEETMSVGSVDIDGECVSLHDKSLDVVYEDDVDVAVEVFEPVVNEDELDDAESLNSSSTNSVVCVTDVIVSDVVDELGNTDSEDVIVCVNGNSTKEQLIPENRFTTDNKLKIDIKEITSDSDIDLVESTDTKAKAKREEETDTAVIELGKITSEEVEEADDKNLRAEIFDKTRSEIDEVANIVEITNTTDNVTFGNSLENITAESNVDTDEKLQGTKVKKIQAEIHSCESRHPVMKKTDESLVKTESVIHGVESTMKENNINNSTSQTEESEQSVCADVIAYTDLTDSTQHKTTSHRPVQVPAVHNNNTGRKLQAVKHEHRYNEEEKSENISDPSQNYSDQKQNNIIADSSFHLADENSQGVVDNKVIDINTLDEKQTRVGVEDKYMETGAERNEAKITASEISGLKYENTGVLKIIDSIENTNDRESIVSAVNMSIGENVDGTESSVNKTMEQSVSAHTDFSVNQPLDISTEANEADTRVHTANITNESVALHSAGSCAISSEDRYTPVAVVGNVCTNTAVTSDSISTLSAATSHYPISAAADQHALETDRQDAVVTYTHSCVVLCEEHVSQSTQSDHTHESERRKHAENKLEEAVPGSLNPINVNSGEPGKNQNEKNTHTEEMENGKFQELLHKRIASDDSGNKEEHFTEHGVAIVPERRESGVINDIKEGNGTGNRTDQVNTLGSQRNSHIGEKVCEVSETGVDFLEKEFLVSHEKESADSNGRELLLEEAVIVGEIGSKTGAHISDVPCDSAHVTPKMMENIESSFDQLTEGFESETYSSEPNSCQLTSSSESIDSGYDTLKKFWTKARHVSSKVKKKLFNDSTDEIISVSESDDSFIELEEAGATGDISNKCDKMFHSLTEQQCVSCDRQEHFEKVSAPKRFKVNLIKRTYKITKTNVDIVTTHKRDKVVDAVKHTHLVKLEKTTVTAQGPKETPTVVIDQSNMGKEITVVDWSKGDVSSAADIQHISHVKKAVQFLESGTLQPAILDSSEKNILKPNDQPDVLVTATIKHGSQLTDKHNSTVYNDKNNRDMTADTSDLVDIMDGTGYDVERRHLDTSVVVQTTENKHNVLQSQTNIETTQLRQTLPASSETEDKDVKLSEDYHETGLKNTLFSDSDVREDISAENSDTTEHRPYLGMCYQTEEGRKSVFGHNVKMLGELTNEKNNYQTENKEIGFVCEYNVKVLGELSSEGRIQDQSHNPLLYSHDLLTGDNAVNEVTEDNGSQYNKNVDLVETGRSENMINIFQQQTATHQVNVQFVSSVCDNENIDKSSQVLPVQHTAHFLGKDNFPESLHQDPNICTTGNTDVQYDIGIRDGGRGVLLTQDVDREPCSNTHHNKLGDKENKKFIIQSEIYGLKDLYNSDEIRSDVDSHRIFTTTEDKRCEEIHSGSSHSGELGNRAAVGSVSVCQDQTGDVNKGYVSEENNVFDNRDFPHLSPKVNENTAQVDVCFVNKETVSRGDKAVSDIYDSVVESSGSGTRSRSDPSSVKPLRTSVLQNPDTETGVSQPITVDTGTLIADETQAKQRRTGESDYNPLQQTDQSNYRLHDRAGRSMLHADSRQLESDVNTELIIGPETLAPSHSGDVLYGLHQRADKDTERAEQYTAHDSQLFLITNDKHDTQVSTSCVTVKVSATVNRCKIHGVEGCRNENCVVVVTGRSKDGENSTNTMNRSREVEYYDNVGFGSVLEIIEEGLEIIEEDIQHINEDSNKYLGGVSYTETTDGKPIYIRDPENRLDFLREQLLFTTNDEINDIKPLQSSEGFLYAADSTEDLSAGNVRRVKVTGELSDTSLDTSFSSDHVESSSWCDDVTDRLQGKPDHPHSVQWLEEHQRRNPHFATIHRVDDTTFEYSTELVSEDDDLRWMTDSDWLAHSKDDDSKWITDSVLNTDSKQTDNSEWIVDSKENHNSELNTDSTHIDNSKYIDNSKENGNANQISDSQWITDSKISNDSKWITGAIESYNSNSQEKYSSNWFTNLKQLKKCSHHGHVYSFSDEQLQRNLQSFEELLKGFDTTPEESILSKLVFTVVFLKPVDDGSYIEKMKRLYHMLLLEDMERLQNHLCPVIYGGLQLDSQRMQRYLLRGYSRDMATVWHTKRKRVLDSLAEQQEELLQDSHLQDDHSSSLQRDSDLHNQHGAQRTGEQFHRLSDHPGYYKVITGTFSRIPKLRQTDYEKTLSSHEGEEHISDSVVKCSQLSPHADNVVDNSDSLMDYGCVSSAADDDSKLMEEFKKLELLEEDGLLLDDQLQRLHYYRSRFQYNPCLQDNTRTQPAVPFRSSSSDEDMDVN